MNRAISTVPFPLLAALTGILALLPAAGAAPPAPYGGEAEGLSLLRRSGEAVLLASGPVDPSEYGPSEREALERELDALARGPAGRREALLCRFAEGLSAGEIAALGEEGLRVVGAIPSRAYLVRGNPKALQRLLGRPDLCWAARWQAPWKVDPALVSRPPSDRPVFLWVRLFPGEGPEEVAPALEGASLPFRVAAVAGRPEEGRRLLLEVPGESLSTAVELLAAQPAVWSVAERVAPRPLNDDSVWVVQSYDTVNRTNYALSATLWNHGITGTGQVVAVADSGLDSDMCFFHGSAEPPADAQFPTPPSPGTLDPSAKVAAYAVLPGATPYDGFAFFFHGTHVSGSVLGDNFLTPSTPASGGHDAGDGMAPNARLFFQDAGNEAQGTLAGLMADYADIFDQARNAGAFLHSNSWGSDTQGAYTPDCAMVDRYLWEREDMAIFFANGNAGAQGPMTVDSPAAAKNCIAVGALTNGSAGADAVASFSSRGPTQDGRVKPDVCAPGSSIRSAGGDASHSSFNCGIGIMSGTSMATPTAAGAAALLRQYFTDGFYPTGQKNPGDGILPTGALLKAALVAGAMDVGSPGFGNGDEGWGRVNLDNACFFSSPSRDPSRTRLWNRPNGAGLRQGESDTYTLTVGAGRPLKVALVWTDPPPADGAGPALVNDLDLVVEAPGGTLYRGNVFSGGASVSGGSADAVNNVEVAYLPSPAPGTYTLTVHGAEVPGNPLLPESDRQGYALVAVYADCDTAPGAPGAPSVEDHPDAGLALTWAPAAGASTYQIYRMDGACGPEGGWSLVGQSAGPAFTDTRVDGGFTYAYRVRAATGCSEGPPSPCASAAFTGNCARKPEFGGALAAENDPATAACDLLVTWNEGTSRCPLAPGLVYNVYRSTTPGFVPSPATRVAAGVSGSSYRDAEVLPGKTYFYIVRAEDDTSGNGGPAHGGNEDGNLRTVFGTAFGSGFEPGTWSDDGGDTAALLKLEAPWTVAFGANHTPGGLLGYLSAPQGSFYPPNTCAAATTGDIPLPGVSPSLSYWARYNLERDYDGVVVEASTDGGATWTVLTPAEGYPGSFAQTGSVPINACAYPPSQGCFSGPAGNVEPTPWTRFTHNLSAFSGQTVRIRWRLSTDPGAEYEGFFLDDIEISGASVPEACAGPSDDPPAVTVTAPLSGAVLRGTVLLEAEATDDHGVVRVDFLADGQLLGSATAPPFRFSWDTAGRTGSATLTARAVDTLGQTGTSSPVPVTFANPTVASVRKAVNPLRLIVEGTGFQNGAEVRIGGTAAPQTVFKASTKVVAKGSTLKNLLPKGQAVEIRVANPDGGLSGPLFFTR
ncbi:MAG: S8 family serine peptidase [Acidobacteriota bacterium]